MQRRVEPELLDMLAPEDPLAARSRRDLRRVNACMRNASILSGALKEHFRGVSEQLTELGAGDGHLLLSVAHKVAPYWRSVRATLLDSKDCVSEETLAAFTRLGWQAQTMTRDVFDWSPTPGETVLANLFLHHFKREELANLLALIATEARLFIAVEPRRAAWPLICSQMLWVIGCHAVTGHDAVVSVRAGFDGQELTRLWPDPANWQLTERPAGAFSHLFIAHRRS